MPLSFVCGHIDKSGAKHTQVTRSVDDTVAIDLGARSRPEISTVVAYDRTDRSRDQLGRTWTATRLDPRPADFKFETFSTSFKAAGGADHESYRRAARGMSNLECRCYATMQDHLSDRNARAAHPTVAFPRVSTALERAAALEKAQLPEYSRSCAGKTKGGGIPSGGASELRREGDRRPSSEPFGYSRQFGNPCRARLTMTTRAPLGLGSESGVRPRDAKYATGYKPAKQAMPMASDPLDLESAPKSYTEMVNAQKLGIPSHGSEHPGAAARRQARKAKKEPRKGYVQAQNEQRLQLCRESMQISSRSDSRIEAFRQPEWVH